MSASSSPMTQDIWLERMELNGRTLEAVAYGIFVTLVIQSLDIMINKPKPGQRRWPMLLYVAVLFVLGTITFAGEAKYNQTTWVDGRNAPGGPSFLIMTSYNAAATRMAVVSCIFLRWVSDALLVYRCFVVWRAHRWVYIIMVIPTCTSLAIVATGIMELVGMWKSTLFMGNTLGASDFSTSVGLNILVTLMIVWRLLATRRALRETLGAEHAKVYTSISAMLIESAALYSVAGIIYIVAYLRQSSVRNLAFPPLELIQGIAPMLIILRVVQGREWSNEMTTNISFASNPTGPTTLAFSRHEEGSSFSQDVSPSSTAEKVNLGEGGRSMATSEV